MSIYIVTATSTSDDYKRVYSSSTTKMATSYEDAVACAVEFYLEEVSDCEKFEYHDATAFNEIVDANRGDFRNLMTGLFEYFESDRAGMFDGEYVPTTFQVTISDEQNNIELNQSAIAELAFEIRNSTADEE